MVVEEVHQPRRDSGRTENCLSAPADGVADKRAVVSGALRPAVSSNPVRAGGASRATPDASSCLNIGENDAQSALMCGGAGGHGCAARGASMPLHGPWVFNLEVLSSK